MTPRIPPIGLILLVVLLHGGCFYLESRHPERAVKNDSVGYLKLANNLQHHHVFSSDDPPAFSPELFRLPGYPLFLALTGSTSPARVRLAVAIQHLLGIGLLFMAWPALRRWGGRWGAVMGSVFLSLDVAIFLHQGLILTEALLLFFLTIAVLYAMKFLDEPKRSHTVLAGLFFGLTALIKPIAVIPAALLAVCSIKRWKAALAVAVLTFALPAAWVVRNWNQTGHMVYTVQGGAAFLHPAASALALETGTSRADALALLEGSLRREGWSEKTDAVTSNRLFSRKAMETMRQHPRGTIRYGLNGLIRILLGTGLEMVLDLTGATLSPSPSQTSDIKLTAAGTLNVLKQYPILIPLFIGYLLFLTIGYLVAAGGFWKLLKTSQIAKGIFLGGSAVLLLLISSHQGYYRFRIPMMPFLAVLIAYYWGSFTRGKD